MTEVLPISKLHLQGVPAEFSGLWIVKMVTFMLCESHSWELCRDTLYIYILVLIYTIEKITKINRHILFILVKNTIRNHRMSECVDPNNSTLVRKIWKFLNWILTYISKPRVTSKSNPRRKLFVEAFWPWRNILCFPWESLQKCKESSTVLITGITVPH